MKKAVAKQIFSYSHVPADEKIAEYGYEVIFVPMFIPTEGALFRGEVRRVFLVKDGEVTPGSVVSERYKPIPHSLIEQTFSELGYQVQVYRHGFYFEALARKSGKLYSLLLYNSYTRSRAFRAHLSKIVQGVPVVLFPNLIRIPHSSKDAFAEQVREAILSLKDKTQLLSSVEQRLRDYYSYDDLITELETTAVGYTREENERVPIYGIAYVSQALERMQEDTSLYAFSIEFQKILWNKPAYVRGRLIGKLFRYLAAVLLPEEQTVAVEV